ncbi:MAG: ABC transporter substrate-binding protein [Pleomorphochaeta sp.]
MKKLKTMLILFVILASISMPIFSSGEKENSKEDMKITVWIPGDEEEYGFYFEALASFKEKMENEGKSFDYVIEQQPWGDYWTKLPLEVNNKRGPDLFLTHPAYDENIRGISKELSLSDAEKAKFAVTDLYLGPNGEPVYIPTTFVSKVMYVNRALAPNFNTANCKTWDGFVKELEKLLPNSGSADALAEGIIPFQYSYHMLYDLRYNSGKTFTNRSGNPTLDDTGFDFLKSLDDKGVTNYVARESAEDELNNATAAVVYGEPWMEFWASDKVKDVIEAFPVPGKHTTKALELSFGINKNISGAKYELLNEYVKFMLMDKDTITSIVKGSSGTPNLKGLVVDYKAGTAGAANVNTSNALLFLPSQPFEVIVKNLMADWEGLGSTKTREETVKNANYAASQIDLNVIKVQEDLYRDNL